MTKLFFIPVILLRIFAQAQPVVAHPVPEEFSSGYYEVIVNGQQIPVFHAGLNVYFSSFDFSGAASVSITSRHSKSGYSGQTANSQFVKTGADGYWGKKPVIRPLSKNIAARVEGTTVSFTLNAAGQYSVEREGTANYGDDVLFLFANPPETTRPKKNDPHLIYLKAGIHQQHINLTRRQTLYMEPGAVLFGSINVWDAKDVKILGRGTVLYYGPQSETRDDGWKHQKAWHPLTTHNVQGLTVEGITFIARSRTWSVQLYNTFDADFSNVKVIAVNPQNINGDGFDWYGGGRTTIRNSLIRSMDDCFAFFTPRSSEGMWVEGRTTEGEVKDITIENCVLWTTLANIFRIGFNGQALRTDNITLKNSDIIHISKGEWLAPWSLLCAVSPNGRGKALHTNYLLEDIRFEEPAAFFGLQNPEAGFKNIVLKDISMTGQPVSSLVRSNMKNVRIENVVVNGKKLTSETGIVLREGSRLDSVSVK